MTTHCGCPVHQCAQRGAAGDEVRRDYCPQLEALHAAETPSCTPAARCHDRRLQNKASDHDNWTGNNGNVGASRVNESEGVENSRNTISRQQVAVQVSAPPTPEGAVDGLQHVEEGRPIQSLSTPGARSHHDAWRGRVVQQLPQLLPTHLLDANCAQTSLPREEWLQKGASRGDLSMKPRQLWKGKNICADRQQRFTLKSREQATANPRPSVTCTQE